jgi:hypothetical protein
MENSDGNLMMNTLEKAKLELLEINSSLYELEQRKKQVLIYVKGYEDALKEQSIEADNGAV